MCVLVLVCSGMCVVARVCYIFVPLCTCVGLGFVSVYLFVDVYICVCLCFGVCSHACVCVNALAIVCNNVCL